MFGIGSTQSYVSVFNEALFMHFSKTRDENQKKVKDLKCNMDECWTTIAAELYHRTCQYLEDPTPKSHPLHTIVRDIRMGHKHRLEFILPRATHRYKPYKSFILFESLHHCLHTERIAAYYLDRIRDDEMAAAPTAAPTVPNPCSDCIIL